MSKSFIYVLTSIIIVYGCSKNGMQSSLPTTKQTDLTEKFFNLPVNADPTLLKIVNALKKQDTKQHFINQLAKLEGLPQWSFSEAKIGEKNTMQIVVSTNSTKRNTNGSTSSNDTTVLIPLVLDSTQFVNSFIACSVSDTVSFKLFRGREYAQYGYDYVSTKPNAGNIALQCIEFEHQIFKHDTIALLDKKLSMTISGTGKYFPFLRFKPKSVSS
jgi:hypothetical protein